MKEQLSKKENLEKKGIIVSQENGEKNKIIK